MKKILVIGCPGAGKSTFARALHQKTGIPLCHLDMLFWNADKTTVEKEAFLARVDCVLKTDAWILDGNFNSTMEMRMAVCDTVIFLDYPVDVCLNGVRERRGKPRADMPWIETEEDADFMAYIETFHEARRPGIIALLDRYKAGRTVIVLKSREEADAFLEHITDEGKR